MVPSKIPSSPGTSRMARSRCSPTWSCSTTRRPMPSWPWRNLRINFTPSCSWNWSRSSETTRGGQVFISTHSPDFLNGTKLEEIYWLVKEGGFATVRRAADSELLRQLIEAGDLPGSLWKQGLFEGVGLR